MSIHKDGNGKWYVKYRNKTKRGFDSKKTAHEYEMKLKLGIEQNKLKKYKFSYVALDYLESKKKDVAYSSFTLYETFIKRIILPNVADKYIDEINELDCKKFRDIVYETNYSTDRKNTILNHFKNIFIHACRYFGLKNNPSLLIKPFKANYEEKIRKHYKEFNVWTYDEFSKFISFVNDEEYKALYITLFLTGMRLGEALALNWKDLHNHSISITKSHSKKSEFGYYVIKEPKNPHSIRDITINDSLYKYLLYIKMKKMRLKDFDDSWFMFGGRNPLPRTSIERIKNKAISQAKVKKIRIHDFRHSHASNLIGEGMDIVAVSKRLGHSNVSITLQVYTHLIQKNNDKLIDSIEKSSQNLLNL